MEAVAFLNLEHQHKQVADAVNEAFRRVYNRNWFILGDEVARFESEFASFTGTTRCVGVGNGLDALTLSLKAIGVSRGDRVILPAHTFMATWLAVVRTGATPVPVEADPKTFNIDVERIAEKIIPGTKAILPVHLYGQACNMTAIQELAERHEVGIIEDNAQSQGAQWLNRMTGSFGVVNATSFYPTKNLGALGDGGAVTTDDETIYEFLKRNRNYGFLDKNVATDHGLNTRLDELQAAILRIKLQHLEGWNQERRKIADQYLKNLHDVGDLTLPLSDKEATHVYHLFVIRTGRRNELRSHLEKLGIQTMIHYPIPPHLQPAFAEFGFRTGDFPVAENIASTALSLPLWPGLSSNTVDRVCEAIRRFF